jgi:hypothetical protein
MLHKEFTLRSFIDWSTVLSICNEVLRVLSLGNYDLRKDWIDDEKDFRNDVLALLNICLQLKELEYNVQDSMLIHEVSDYIWWVLGQPSHSLDGASKGELRNVLLEALQVLLDQVHQLVEHEVAHGLHEWLNFV